MQNHDLVIRGGTIVDGSGSAPLTGDVTIQDRRIEAMGQFSGKGREENDAAAGVGFASSRRGDHELILKLMDCR